MSAKINANPLKGMIDLHPQEMEKHVFVHRGIERIAQAFCYERYQLPILEALDTFTHQGSTELITEQSYGFTDRGGREVLLRPEITPGLARMVAKENGRYTLPLRWYTIGNCYRYENPQKGRLREFAQLNFDIIGKQHILYDIEIFQLIIALMDTFQVASSSYVIRYNHRTFVEALLTLHGMESGKQKFYSLIDKKPKMDEARFYEVMEETFTRPSEREFIRRYLATKNPKELLAELEKATSLSETHRAGVENFKNLTHSLSQLNFSQPPVFDPTIVRGIDYYTGMVFEVFAKTGSITRALFGGGRYDSLVGNYGSHPMSAVGFGMGIHIFTLFLLEMGLLPEPAPALKTIYLAPLSEEVLSSAFVIAEHLREEYEVCLGEPRSFKAHFKRAEQKQCGYIAALGENEIKAETLDFKPISHKEPKTSLNLKSILKSP